MNSQRLLHTSWSKAGHASGAEESLLSLPCNLDMSAQEQRSAADPSAKGAVCSVLQLLAQPLDSTPSPRFAGRPAARTAVGRTQPMGKLDH
jgi:hypothetical protein